MGKWSALATLDIIGSPGFGYGFRARESVSISDSSNTEEKYHLELADSYYIILNRSPSDRMENTAPNGNRDG